MSFLAGLGHFAGGATKGYLNMNEELRRQEDYEEQRKERDKKRQIDAAAKEEFGKVGTRGLTNASPDEGGDMPMLGPEVTQDDAYRSLANRAMGIDPMQGMRLQQAADQRTATGLQISAGKRAERGASQQEQLSQLRRLLASGADPVQVYKKLWEVNTGTQSGFSSNMFTFNGQPHMSVFRDGQPEASVYPITPQTVGKALDAFEQALMAPADRQRLGLEVRRVEQGDRGLGIQEQNARSNEEWRRDQSEHNRNALDQRDRHHAVDTSVRRETNARMGASGNSLNPLQAYSLEQQKAFDTARAGIVAELEAGRIKPDEAQRRLNILAMRFGSTRSDPRPQGGWKPSNDGTWRQNDAGDIQDWVPDRKNPSGGKWVLRGGPTATEQALSRGGLSDSDFGGPPAAQPRAPQQQQQQPSMMTAPPMYGMGLRSDMRRDPIISSIDLAIREAAVNGDAARVQQLTAGKQQYINERYAP